MSIFEMTDEEFEKHLKYIDNLDEDELLADLIECGLKIIKE